MCQLVSDVGGQSRNEILKRGGAGFKLLKVELSFQVSGACLKNDGTLMATVLTLSFTMLSAMMLLHGNLTLIAEKKIKSNHVLRLL